MSDFEKLQEENERKNWKDVRLIIVAALIAGGIFTFAFLCGVLHWGPR